MTDKDIAKMDTFDFSPTIEKLRVVFDSEHPDYIPNHPHPGAYLLEMHQFPEFAVFFFTDKVTWDEIYSYAFESNPALKKKNSLPPSRIHESKLYKEYLSPNFPERQRLEAFSISANLENFQSTQRPSQMIRRQDVYPLTHSETELSVEFITKNPSYLMAMIGIKLCIMAYFNGIKIQLKNDYNFLIDEGSFKDQEQIKKLQDGYQRLAGNAFDFSFIQDLTPLLANIIRQHENPWTVNSFGCAIRDAFHRHAFKSVVDKEIYNECPFSKSLINCLSIGFDTVTGQPVAHHGHGALILWVMDKVQKEYLSQKPADHITQHFNL